MIEADGRYPVPGLTDSHMHVESSMCTITEYVRAGLPHGTGPVFTKNALTLPGDIHDIVARHAQSRP